MSLSFVAASSATGSFASDPFNTITVPKPAGIAVGDLLLGFVCSRYGTTPSAPSGWTLVLHPSGQNEWCWQKVATSSDVSASSFVFTGVQQTNGYAATVVAYRGANTATPVGASAGGTVTPGSPILVATSSVTPTMAGSVLVAYFDLSYAYNGTVNPTGMTQRVSGSNGGSYELWDQPVGATATGTRTRSTESGAYQGAMAVVVQPQNSAPNSPTLNSPANASTFDRGTAQRFAWTFSDVDAGDSQSAFTLQYRLVGAGTWTQVMGTTPNSFYDFAAGAFAAGNYEWQVSTADALGVVGPFSASSFFTAATPPTGPTITAPVNGSTIGLNTGTVTWSASSQDAFQVRRVADAAGSPDTTTVYSDTGIVADSSTRSASLSFPTNNRYEHVQVRVRYSTLWSTWSSVRVLVSYTAPTTPTVTVTPVSTALLATSDSISVSVTNPVVNLLTLNQSSVETDTTGWTSDGTATITRSTAQAINGSASMSLASSGTGAFYAYGLAGYRPAVVGGQVYTIVASFRAATVSRAVRVEVGWYDASSAFIGTSAGPQTADNTSGWTQASYTVQAPANAAFAHVAVTVMSAGAAGEVHYVDAIGLRADPTGNLVANPDFENGTTGWLGGAATTSQDTSRAYAGRASCKVVAQTYAGVQSVYSNPVVAVAAGTTVTVSAYVYVPAGTVGVRVNINGPGISGNNYGPTSTVTDAWTRISATATTTAAGGVYAEFDFSVANQAAGVTFWIDAVQVVVGSTPQPYVPPVTYNLVTNPSFEVDLSTWSVGNGATSFARVTSQSYVGTASASGTCTSAGADVCIYVGGAKYPASSGLYYTGSAYFKAGSTSRTTGVRLDWYNGATYLSSSSVGNGADTPGTWTRATITALAPAGTDSVQIALFAYSCANGEVHYFDAVQVELGSVATDYFDGSTDTSTKWEASENLFSAAASSFEDGTTAGWTAQSGTAITNVGQGQGGIFGSKTLKATVSTTGTFRGAYGPSTLTTLPGVTYTASAWVYVESGASVTVRIQLTDNVSGGPQTERTIPANAWTRVSTTGTVPTGSTFGTVAVDSGSSSSTAGGALYIDAIQVEQRPIATPYASTGAANGSVSKRQKPWEATPPTVTSNDIFVRPKLDPSKSLRVKALLGPNGTWTWPTPASGVEYEFQVRATAVNGVTATSTWTA